MTHVKERPRARFAPIPIETTFERYRKTIPPGAELTPSPSPRSPAPPPLEQREKRKFAPQLVESSVRRAKRAGDEGPATKYTDRTDITPYTNHIYAPKARKKHGHTPVLDAVDTPRGHGRRESCDDEIAGGVFDLVARDAQRKLQEVAMSAFPNFGNRIGGAEHFYVREGSGSEDGNQRGRPLTRGPWDASQTRRNSSEEDISWAFKEMQEHAQVLHRTRTRSRIDTLDLDNMSIDGPPSDAMGLTRTQRSSIASSPIWTTRGLSSSSLGPVGEPSVPLLRAESPLPTIGESVIPFPSESPALHQPGSENHTAHIPSAPAGKAGDIPYASASQIPPETGFRNHGPFMSFPAERDVSLDRARQQHKLRLKVSPPMLGQDLTFRRCPSPKQTKLEPDHLWDITTGTTYEEHNRDPTEQHGLWRGYCYTAHVSSEKLAPVDRPAMLSTPAIGAGGNAKNNPFAAGFGGLTSAPAADLTFSEEPTPFSPSSISPIPGTVSVPPNNTHQMPGHHTKPSAPKGLHMLQNLANIDEKLKKEKAAAELEEKIAAEFDDHFITQVYNYLSLGYPATGRQYDDELSKISRIDVAELGKEDQAIMDGVWADTHNRHNDNEEMDIDGAKPNGHPVRRRSGATGHIMLDSEEKDDVREEDRCQRWKALKLYIFEWARQHPDLNAIGPAAWGVRERRGSWGI
ncbi:uncharacterized protein C8A04DRAFT_13855 [Dichotomopilus funicola]|uniref:Uncharacterized protein n=1 Tax=Dichotomopilus funicola TaxID=1934379 RepID=A0AAN6ZLI9_9PEZI|nr:hypothetical protein C8A04DRAFT_13855 [Dichotomopilus funicola]